MLKDTPSIASWVATDCVKDDVQMTIGNYTYLDGALHVQLALAADAIMQQCESIRGSRRTSIAFLCTPTDDHVIPQEARDFAKANYEKKKFWQKLLVPLGLLVPNFSNQTETNEMCVVDGIIQRQGPNYALAKRIQHWRAILARSGGCVVSSNVVCLVLDAFFLRKLISLLLGPFHCNGECAFQSSFCGWISWMETFQTVGGVSTRNQWGGYVCIVVARFA